MVHSRGFCVRVASMSCYAQEHYKGVLHLMSFDVFQFEGPKEQKNYFYF